MPNEVQNPKKKTLLVSELYLILSFGIHLNFELWNLNFFWTQAKACGYPQEF